MSTEKILDKTKENQCQFCQRSFARESTLAAHLCEPKRRHQQRDSRGVQIGFQAYLKFYQLTQGSTKTKTYEDFARSNYYRAFVRFGNYCLEIQAINIARFVEWLLRQNKKLDQWASDRAYTEYLLSYLKIEAVSDALARAIEYSIAWSEKNNSPSRDCLRFGNANATCYAVTAGRISPWVIYNCESGQKFLSSLNSEQIEMIWPYIDSDYWTKKFKEYSEEQAWAADILRKAGW